MIKRTFSYTELGIEHTGVAYSTDNMVWFWESNDSPCPLDACLRYEIPCNSILQKLAIEKHNEKMIRDYRERMKNYSPSHEEITEMRANFGEGTKVVNVITGKTTSL